jgi:hypothetical protein
LLIARVDRLEKVADLVGLMKLRLLIALALGAFDLSMFSADLLFLDG